MRINHHPGIFQSTVCCTGIAHMKLFSAFAHVFAIFLLASSSIAAQPTPPGQAVTAIFAGGCFWCVEADFDKVPGVIATESGYAGGKLQNPTYEQVSAGGTGHAEAVRVTYDPAKVSHEKLLDFFLHH